MKNPRNFVFPLVRNYKLRKLLDIQKMVLVKSGSLTERLKRTKRLERGRLNARGRASNGSYIGIITITLGSGEG